MGMWSDRARPHIEAALAALPVGAREEREGEAVNEPTADNPITPLARWLAWLDGHDGRLHRRRQGGNETDLDLAALIPTPPGSTVLTVGDLRRLVEGRAEKQPPSPSAPDAATLK